MIIVKNLSKCFGKFVVFDLISVKIERGFMFILGLNGGGKSIFLKLCVGFYRFSLGRVEVFGEVFWSNERVKLWFGVFFDLFVFLKYRIGWEWFDYIVRFKGVDDDNVLESVEMFLVMGFFDRWIGEYFVGMMKWFFLV